MAGVVRAPLAFRGVLAVNFLWRAGVGFLMQVCPAKSRAPCSGFVQALAQLGAMSLFSGNTDLPGVVGATRILTGNAKGFKKLGPGDIAFVDAPDIDRTLAQRLLAAKPAVVVNVSKFSTGTVPNFGPSFLAAEGIILVEQVGASMLDSLKENKKARVTDDGEIFYGQKLIGAGEILTPEHIEGTLSQAQLHLAENMEAFFGNTIAFVQQEAPLFIDGLGIPDVDVDLRGRKVLVASPGSTHRVELKNLANFIREFSPVIIGVGEAADTLAELGHKPDIIVGDASQVSSDTLRSGAQVILPADTQGHVSGLERIQDLGIGAVTFPASGESATDLALLLAEYHGASMVVNVGGAVDLDAVIRGEYGATPSALLSRAKVGTKLVDAASVIDLYTIRGGGGWRILAAVFSLLVALAVIIAIAGFGGDDTFVNNLIDTWNNIALSFQGLFRSK